MGDLNGNPLRLSSTEMGDLNGNHGVGSFKRGLQRGIWTPEEDQLLTKYIEAHGEGHWSSLPHKAGLLRGGKSCRLRWMNYLRPNIKRGNISQDEEELIIRMHNLLGNRWTLIAGRIPGRTDNEIKNYWNSHLRKKLCRKASNTLLLDCNPVSNHVQNTRKSEQTSHAEQEHVKNNEESSLLQNATKPDLNIEYNKESGCHASNLHSYFHVLSHLDDCYTYFQGYTDTLSERTKLMDPDIEIDWDEVLDGEAGTSVEDCNHLSGFPLWFEW